MFQIFSMINIFYSNYSRHIGLFGAATILTLNFITLTRLISKVSSVTFEELFKKCQKIILELNFKIPTIENRTNVEARLFQYPHKINMFADVIHLFYSHFIISGRTFTTEIT